ncbi:type II toxin-antitoxin system RelE/ParE family toxin [Bacteroides sp. 519]|uniref:type II toxin-antitoxin system RelE/ParE family toxin n=1 Tax=Bacteroides sp. 519 TaxID=2302937 RepID=UPI0013D1F269|nr:type II toxin-antitoxin system RelE/ParE family toxin [Bacteroides sp. 519]NDV59872.1 type II toxin-antitoxin system RelE/ParE family toxin [Bacteroides sp. 519]
MTLELEWSSKALNDLDTLYNYYYVLAPQVATRLYNEVIDEAEQLLNWPNIGKIDHRFSNTPGVVRSLVILDGLYQMFYYVEGKYIVIARVWNCRQDPKKLDL